MAGKEPFVYIDGEYHPKGEAKISVYDHGLLYGDGVFEGIRAYNGTVFRLREHIERLFEGLRVIRVNIPLAKEQLMTAIIETLRKNNLNDAYIRLVIPRGRGNLDLDPVSCPKPSIIIMTEPVLPANGKDARDRGVTAAITSRQRAMVDGQRQV